MFLSVSSEIHPYPNQEVTIKKFKELLDKVNFETQDLILLNNYNSPFMPARGDRRKIGWDIKEYSYNETTKTLEIDWIEKYNMKKYFWIPEENNYLLDTDIGTNDWYRSFFFIINKTDITDSNSLNIEMKYDWIK